MSITADIILDKRRKTIKGYPIKIRIYDGISHKYISLKRYQDKTKLSYDSFLKQRSIELQKEVDFCNKNKFDISQSIDLILTGVPENDIELEIKILESKLRELKKRRLSGVGLIQFLNLIISERKSVGKDDYAYHNVMKSAERFIYPEEDIDMNEIDYEWINAYKIHYLKKGLSESTISTYLSIMRAGYKQAQRRDSLGIKSDNPFIDIGLVSRKKIEYDIDQDDLKKILNFDWNNLKTRGNKSILEYKKMFDLFLFQFAIGGHDYAEIASLKWKMIKKGRIVFRRFKNREKLSQGVEVDNYLNEFALKVIEKYGDKNSERVFSFIPDPLTDKYNYKQHTTYLARSFGYMYKHLGLNDRIKTKTPRYVFRTIAGNLLIETLIIMKIQGHSPRGMTFGYQGAINKDVQDKEHKKVLDLVFN